MGEKIHSEEPRSKARLNTRCSSVLKALAAAWSFTWIAASIAMAPAGHPPNLEGRVQSTLAPHALVRMASTPSKAKLRSSPPSSEGLLLSAPRDETRIARIGLRGYPRVRIARWRRA